MTYLTRLDVITPATSQVISLRALQDFTRVFGDGDDAILSAFIDTATDLAQNYLNRVLMSQTLMFTIAHANGISSSQYQGYYGNGAGVWNNFGSSFFSTQCNNSIELPRPPVQNVLSVARGTWGQSVDTFLVENSDYYVDLSATFARVRLINYNQQTFYPQPDHLSIVYVAGYDQTNTINLSGTATASGSVVALIGNVSLSAEVSSGDAAPTVALSLLAALQAAYGAPSASLITPTMIQLRGADTTVQIGSVPTGLALNAGTPNSAIPPAISNAIIHGAAYLYQNLADPTATMPEWFFSCLAPYRLITFA